MDVYKMQQKYKITKKEIRNEATEQAEEFIDLITKPIEDPQEYERVLNLKDFQLATLKRAGILNDDNRSMYFAAVFKTVVEQYWKQVDLPKDDRDIYNNSYTDAGLKKVQKEYLKILRSRVRTYKKEITDWWAQRDAEDAYFTKSIYKKPNGKMK